MRDGDELEFRRIELEMGKLVRGHYLPFDVLLLVHTLYIRGIDVSKSCPFSV